MPFCSELFYRDYENNAAEKGAAPLVLLHGSGGSHMAWPAELRRMPGRRVIALDLPGHGQSGGSACRNVNTLCACLHDFLRERRLQKVILAGHSLGAILALAYAAEFSSELQGLILLSCGGRLNVPGVLIDSLLLPQQTGQFSEHFNRIAFDAGFPQAERRKITEPLAKAKTSTLLMDLEICAEFRMPVKLGMLQFPALLINGAGDPIATPSCARQLAYSLPNASLTILPGCGHMCVYEKTALIQQMLRDFIAGIK